MKLEPSAPLSLQQWLERHADTTPSKPALVTPQVRLNYEQLNEEADRTAAAFAGMGIRSGDRIALFLDNCAETAIAFLAALKAKAVAVPLNGLLKDRKLSRLLTDCGARLLIAQTRKQRIVLEAAKHGPALPPLLWVGPRSAIPAALAARSWSWESRPAAGRGPRGGPSAERAVGRSRALAAIVYTSGSTGEPKGVMVPARAMLAAARSIVQYLGHNRDDIILSALPLSFSYGLYQLVTTILTGSTLVLEPSFLYPVRILERIEREQITALPLVPTMVSMLRQLQNIRRYRLDQVRYLTSAASAMPPEHLGFLREFLPRTRIFLMYGLTECVRVSYLPPEDVDRRPDSVGIPMPRCRIRLVKDDGTPAGPGEMGELQVQGPNVMAGYWNDPQRTAAVFRRDPDSGRVWLSTGDLFTMDEQGYLTFAARRDDLIKTRGERVSPREIEQVIRTLDLVREVVVVGLADEVLGQSIAAAVVLHQPLPDGPTRIRAHCARHLESFMVPQRVFILEQLPLSPHGKVDRSRIRNRLEQLRADRSPANTVV